MFSKVKNFANNNVAKVLILTGAVVATAESFALADTTDPTTAMTTALTTGQTQILGGLAGVAPIAIGICVAFLVYKYGIKFFKGLSK